MATYTPPLPQDRANSPIGLLEAQIDALWAELGANPSGTYVDVEARLDAIEAGIVTPPAGRTYAEMTGAWSAATGTWADQ